MTPDDCIICTCPSAQLITLPCGCRLSVHKECLATWVSVSSRSCLLLCDVSHKNAAFEDALESLLYVMLLWTATCALILYFGSQYSYAMVHFCAWIVVQHNRQRLRRVGTI
jgi:hypothetical protein